MIKGFIFYELSKLQSSPERLLIATIMLFILIICLRYLIRFLVYPFSTFIPQKQKGSGRTFLQAILTAGWVFSPLDIIPDVAPPFTYADDGIAIFLLVWQLLILRKQALDTSMSCKDHRIGAA